MLGILVPVLINMLLKLSLWNFQLYLSEISHWLLIKTVEAGTQLAYSFELEGDTLPTDESGITVEFRNEVNHHTFGTTADLTAPTESTKDWFMPIILPVNGN